MSVTTEDLVEALRRLLRHEPWPPSVQSERDYAYAAEVFARIGDAGTQGGRPTVLDGGMPEEAGAVE